MDETNNTGCLVLLGLLVTICGILFLVYQVVFYVRSEVAIGYVVGNDEMKGGLNRRGLRQGPTYAPIFEFKDKKGDLYRVKSSFYSSVPDQTGKITVLYLAKDPQNAKVSSFFQMWLMPLFLTLFGGFFLYVASRSRVSPSCN